ncbi:MAG: winged helix-turn-helix transcriptional regulator [Candidatus Binatia bacterium]
MAPTSRTRRSPPLAEPVLALLDLLGHRWALRVLWELRRESLSFRALQARCGGVSPTVLNTRLAELRAAGIVDLALGHGYGLSGSGRTLLDGLAPLRGWATRWMGRARPAKTTRTRGKTKRRS